MFIAKDGHIVFDEAKAWVEEAGLLAGEDDEKALALLQQALAWYQTKIALAHGEEGKAACWAGEGICLARMGEIQAAREDWKEAANLFRQASTVFGNVGAIEANYDLTSDYRGAQNEALCLAKLAQARGVLKKYRKSLEAADQALDLFRALEDRDGELQALRLGGYACADLGLVKEAVERLEAAVRLAREAGDRKLAAQLQTQIARIRKP